MINDILTLPNAHEQPIQRININNPSNIYDIGFSLKSLLSENKQPSNDLVIVCIGTDRSTGDSLGLLTGTKLKYWDLSAYLFGTLENPVHATNLSDILSEIKTIHPQAFLIAVDACLGCLDNVGCISIGVGPLKPGAGVNKDLPEVGHMYISGVVNIGGFMEHLVLQSTRLHLVMKMADTIAWGLSYALHSKIH